MCPKIKLYNGNEIPQMGFGVFKIKGDELTEKCVLEALKVGYRHIDTAHYYENERGVGAAIKKSGIPREEIWVTSKIWVTEYGSGKTTSAIEKMLKRLDLEYIDLVLLHFPFNDYLGAYKELEVTLKQIQAKIADLHEIDFVYQEILKIQENKAYIEYLMHLFDVESVRREIADCKRLIDKEEQLRITKQKELQDLEQENIALQESARELYNMLQSNETFKAEEYTNREILKTQANIASLEANQQAFLKRSSQFKDIINQLRRLSDEKIYQEGRLEYEIERFTDSGDCEIMYCRSTNRDK